MRFIADLHLHSHFSRATSRDLDLPHLAEWAQLKGISVVGTADFTHPQWFEDLEDQLEPAEPGLFRLRGELWDKVEERVPFACRGEVRFLLTVEISSIYKKGDRTRKVHNVVLAPSFAAAARLNAALARIGNLASDGRPVLGLDCRDLLQIVLDVGDGCFLIPAHIWTPHFAVLGAASGFDSLEDCFGDLAPHIFAVETGLSSDPPMNWRLSQLDRLTLVSNSDAHSLAKLGREATVFDTELSFGAIRAALETGDPQRFLGTIEFFPEEGKYHFDGHRSCGVRWSPAETREHNRICSVCGKPVTVGVLHRVEELADRPEGGRPDRTHRFRNFIPLPELLSETLGCGPNSQTVDRAFRRIITELGPELHILEHTPLAEVDRVGGSRLCEAIERMRGGRVNIEPGYDGVYGVVRVFRSEEHETSTEQPQFF
jgi:DNA helicase-2/ATP-dependent DNA helicase PcrA